MKATQSFYSVNKLGAINFFLLILTFLITTSCDLTDPKKDKPKPEGYQEDIPWPSLEGVPWAIHHGNPQFTGRSKEVGPQLGIVEWQIKLPNKGYRFSSILSPVIGKDGTIIFVSYDDIDPPGSFLYAVSSDGDIKWRFPLSTDKNTAPPIISSSGNIYVADWESDFFCLDTDGNLKWNIKLNRPSWGIMNIDKEGNIYGMAADGVLYSFTPDGSIRWQLKISDFGTSSDAIAFSPDGNTLYLKNKRSGIYGISTAGEIKWKFSEIDFSKDYTSPLVTSQGMIFTLSGSLPIKSDGTRDTLLEQKISYGIGKNYLLDITPTIDKYGNLYIASEKFIIS